MTQGIAMQSQSPGTAHADLGFWLQSQIIGQPMAMREENLNALVESIAANRFSLPRNRTTGARITEKGTAIVEIHGVLINRMPVMGTFWGLTAYEGLGEQFRRIKTNADIKRVVLDVDSPGGLVAGIRTCADALEDLAEEKPVYAVAHDMACSAGYWLACIAEELSVTPDGDVGSIGVRGGHVSYAQLLDRAGIDIRVIKAGRTKADHAISELLSDGAAAEMQFTCDRQYDRFVAHVAQHRPLSEYEVRDTDARCWVGQDAVDAGLADRVETLEELVERIEKNTARVKPRRKLKTDKSSKGGLAPSQRSSAPPRAPGDDEPTAAYPRHRGGRTVSDRNEPGAAGPDYAQIIAAYTAGIAASKTTPAAPAAGAPAAPAAAAPAAPAAAAAPATPAEAATAARERIKAIMGSEAAKTRPGLAQHIALETDLDAKTAEALLGAAPAEAAADKGKTELGSALEKRMSQGGNAAGIKPDGSGPAAQRPSLADHVAAKYQPAAKKGA